MKKEVEAIKGKTKGFIHEFKEFISRGNVVDLAVGMIIGSAFTSIVKSLVSDIIMPAIGFLIGGLQFTDYKWVLSPATETEAEVAIMYGSFIQQAVDFLIIAFVIFCMIKMITRFRKKEEEKAEEVAPTPEDIKLLTEIRDLLKK
ncbi:MAG: large-conductance mechanosensitive channel protein MscL [Clostridia bacterium]|nr:large-conductance mechanosensitive channel protein MscL [Clostridia bacterium]